MEKHNEHITPLCMENKDITEKECNDTVIDHVIYRVWSAFENNTNIEDSLSELMLRQLESEDEQTETEGLFLS